MEANSQEISEGLQLAINRFNNYDFYANDKKDKFKQRRRFIIRITFISSLLVLIPTLFSAIFPNFQIFASDSGESNAINRVINVIGVLIFTAPIILPKAAKLILEADQSKTPVDSTTAWVQCRYVAERIRSALYLYRLKAEPYHDDPDKALDGLLKEMNSIQVHFISDEAHPKNQPKTINELVAQNFEEYKTKRLEKQLKWYKDRTQVDYQNYKKYQNIILVISIVGLVCGVIFGVNEWQRGVGLTAIITVLGLAIQAWMNVNMIGKTFMVYTQTYNELEEYKAFSMKGKTDAEIVSDVEKILMKELEIWYLTALEIQSQTSVSLENLMGGKKN